MRDRLDLTNWVMHFIHDRNYNNEPNSVLSERFDYCPYDFVQGSERKFEDWDSRDEEYAYWPDAPAFNVLLKIIIEGHIRRGWSFRGNRATIYGPKAACCFTEMPLYALLEYAKRRGSTTSILPYGIALPRDEFFRAGGRPVIYGLTGDHKEVPDSEFPRLLHPSCGFGPHEQYRYVAMSLDPARWIDWSHEREWRWSDPANSCGCPGLPIWLDEEPIRFSCPLIMVREEREVPLVLDTLKEMFDAGSSDYSDLYDKNVIANTRVFSVERFASTGKLSRLDELPSHQLASFKRPTPTTDDFKKLRSVLGEASDAAKLAAIQYRETYPRNPNGDYQDVFGFASLMVHAPQSILVEALISIGAISTIAGVGYRIKGVFEDHCRTHMLTELENAAEAARKVLERHYPGVSFFVRSRMD